MSEESPDEAGEPEDGSAEEAHLADVPDGCGCVEVWELLSERRGEDDIGGDRAGTG